jgi:non-homologous end joining protein Ku
MRGDHALLAVTTVTDEMSGEIKPLFSFPIQICKALEDKEPSFDIAAPSGAPRKQQFVDSGTGELVENDECQHGVFIGATFKPITDEQMEEIKQATKIDTLVVTGQLDLADVPFARTLATYYVQSPPKGGSAKAYRLVYEALCEVRKGKKIERSAKALVTKRTPRSRQALCVIYPDMERKCLMLAHLRFAAQLKDPDEAILAPQLAQVEEVQVEKARQVIDNLGDGLARIDTEVDEALALREKLIEQALAGEELSLPTPVAESVASESLEDQLEASLAAL